MDKSLILAIFLIAAAFIMTVNYFMVRSLQQKAQQTALTKVHAQYLVAIAAGLAAPHLSPDPRHIEENRLILRHWLDFTRNAVQDGVLPL